jgi:hypothetical protein
MKNLFFVLLGCLLTACFRAPHLSIQPTHSPVRPAAEAAVPLPPDPDGYASADRVAAAGTATPEVMEPYRAPAARPAYAPQAGDAPAVKAKPATRPVQLRRALRKAVRTALLHKRPAAATQDNPAPEESGLPTVALIAGIIGIVGLVGSFAGSVISLGAGAGVLFLLGFLGGLTATIAGGIAKGRIRRGQDAESGREKATAGLILGIVSLGIILLLLALLIVLIIAWGGGFG